MSSGEINILTIYWLVRTQLGVKVVCCHFKTITVSKTHSGSCKG